MRNIDIFNSLINDVDELRKTILEKYVKSEVPILSDDHFSYNCTRYLKEISKLYSDGNNPDLLDSLQHVKEKMQSFLNLPNYAQKSVDILKNILFLEFNKNNYRQVAYKLRKLLDEHGLNTESMHLNQTFERLNLSEINYLQSQNADIVALRELTKKAKKLFNYIAYKVDRENEKKDITEVVILFSDLVSAQMQQNGMLIHNKNSRSLPVIIREFAAKMREIEGIEK